MRDPDLETHKRHIFEPKTNSHPFSPIPPRQFQPPSLLVSHRLYSKPRDSKQDHLRSLGQWVEKVVLSSNGDTGLDVRVGRSAADGALEVAVVAGVADIDAVGGVGAGVDAVEERVGLDEAEVAAVVVGAAADGEEALLGWDEGVIVFWAVRGDGGGDVVANKDVGAGGGVDVGVDVAGVQLGLEVAAAVGVGDVDAVAGVAAGVDAGAEAWGWGEEEVTTVVVVAAEDGVGAVDGSVGDWAVW